MKPAFSQLAGFRLGWETTLPIRRISVFIAYCAASLNFEFSNPIERGERPAVLVVAARHQ